MKNKIKYLLVLLILLVPSFVLAKDTCNDNEIKIKSITLKELSGFSEKIKESSINNNTINLNLKMYDVGDSSTYYITVENTSSEDYYFTKDSMKLENDYLEYSLRNDSEVIPAKEEKIIELKVSYKNKIPNEKYSDTSKLIISLSDKPLENPKTKMSYTFIFIIISLISITIYTKINNKLINKKKLLLVISLLSTLPITTKALCIVSLNVETKIEIENKEAIFLPGLEVNIKMKELAGDDTSTFTNGCDFLDQNIISIKYSNFEPIAANKEEKNIVSTPDSPYPIYMWYENNIIYWWSNAKHPYLNASSRRMCQMLDNLVDISGLKYFNTSQVTDIAVMFWNTSSLENIDPLSNWNVSRVTDMSGMFWGPTAITSLKALKNWDTSNVENMFCTFIANRSLTNLEGLENWNVSKVTDMRGMFRSCEKIENLDPLSNWDVSSVTTMDQTFSIATSLKNIEGIKNWDMSNVTNMNAMFQSDKSLTNLHGIENWDVSNVAQFNIMFAGLDSLEDASSINDWNIQKNASW